MSVIAEVHSDDCMRFAERGLTKDDGRDHEIAKFFSDRVYYGDVTVGIIKSYRSTDIEWAKKHGHPTREVVLVYNPRWRYSQKGRANRKKATRWYWKTHGIKMITDEEQMKAVTVNFIDHYFAKYVVSAQRGYMPIIRLEDLNLSLKLHTGFFARFMEWLTGVEWTEEYVDFIREHNTPAYQYDNWLEWEVPPFGGRVTGVFTRQWEKKTWNRHNWDPDPFLVKYWTAMEDWEKSTWMEHAADTECALGYNRGLEIARLDDWKFRGAYEWGDVYE